MKKNVAGQSIGAELITAADGTAFTGTVTVYITGDNGTQALGSVGSGVCTHEGNGYHSYAPAQAETNYTHIAFTFIGTGAVPATLQMFTSFPQTVDNNVLAAGATGFAAIDTVVDFIKVVTDKFAFTVANQVDSNSLSVGGAAQTANDNGADINTLLTRIVGTLATGTHNPATAAQIAVLSDWINGGRLDLILDIIAADTTTDIPALISALNDVAATEIVSGGAINTTAGAVDSVTLVATTSVNTDMVTEPPTAVQNRQEMDSNSTQLNTTIPGLIDDLAIKKNTAFSNFEFLMVLTSDHVTPATGLTVTGQRSIDGAAFAGVTGTIAEVSNGIYQFDALAADTNGDVITWRFSSATADDTFMTFKTVA